MNDLTTALILNPKSTAALFEKGYAYYSLYKDDSAIYFYNNAIYSKGSDSVYIEFNDDLYKDGLVQEDVHMPELRFFRGLAFYSKHMYSLALADFYFSKSYNYDLPRTDYYIGIILLSYNIKERGCNFLRIADSLGNKKAKSYLKDYCN